MKPMTLLPVRRGVISVPVRRLQAQPASVNRIDPWNDLETLDQVFNSLFRAPVTSSGETRRAAGDPHIELYETHEQFTAYVFAPGIPQSDFELTVTDERLTIKAERKPIFETSDDIKSHTPYSSVATTGGTFNASYDFPSSIDAENATASFKDGVLTIRLPKPAAPKPKQIQVQIENE
jgi:HSP20 family protein